MEKNKKARNRYRFTWLLIVCCSILLLFSIYTSLNIIFAWKYNIQESLESIGNLPNADFSLDWILQEIENSTQRVRNNEESSDIYLKQLITELQIPNVNLSLRKESPQLFTKVVLDLISFTQQLLGHPIVRKANNNWQSLLINAMYNELRHKYEKSIESYKFILSEYKNDIEVEYKKIIEIHLAFCYWKSNQYNHAMNILDRIIGVSKEDDLYTKVAISLRINIYMIKDQLDKLPANLSLENKIYFEFLLGNYNKILSTVSNPSQYEDNAPLLFYLGRSYEETGNLKNAIGLYNQLADLGSSSMWQTRLYERITYLAKKPSLDPEERTSLIQIRDKLIDCGEDRLIADQLDSFIKAYQEVPSSKNTWFIKENMSPVRSDPTASKHWDNDMSSTFTARVNNAMVEEKIYEFQKSKINIIQSKIGIPSYYVPSAPTFSLEAKPAPIPIQEPVQNKVMNDANSIVRLQNNIFESGKHRPKKTIKLGDKGEFEYSETGPNFKPSSILQGPDD